MFLLHKNAKNFEFKQSDTFLKTLSTKVKDDFLINFNSEDWSYNKVGSKGQGLTMESLYVAEILVFLINDKDSKDKVEIKVKNALSKLL